MQNPPRKRDYGGGSGYQVKRGHVPQISISDDNHHVTEAIGDMYGDNSSYGKRDSRPLSFVSSPLNDSFERSATKTQNPYDPSNPRSPKRSSQTYSNFTIPQVNGQDKPSMAANNSFGRESGPVSPPLDVRQRAPSDTANSQFPLNNVDYESNPAAVAQELSNLQALRRMSMDVNAAADPDLPAFNTSFGMPTVAPTASADEDDASRLFWVPARLHPELAPQEFKTFLDSRVDALKKRRSGESSLSPDGPHRQGSGGGLRRKKSMLSRQIDNSGGRGAEGYTDGAERLERKRSSSGTPPDSNLQDLEALVNDPANVIQRLSLETEQYASGGEVPASEDLPILPAAPPGHSLRRSTHTTYRRGSLRKGERVPFSRRAARVAHSGAEDSPTSSPILGPGEHLGLSRVQTEPTPAPEKPAENFSRPSRSPRSRAVPTGTSQPISPNDGLGTKPESEARELASAAPVPKQFVSSFATNGRSSVPAHVFGHPIPQIVETPPPQEEPKSSFSLSHKSIRPERSSSHEPPPAPPTTLPPQGPLPHGPPANRGVKRPSLARRDQSIGANQTLNDMASHPSPLPGNSTRTDSLSFIPTLTEEKKPEPKKSKDKKDSGNDGGRKSSWSWGSLLGSEEKEKEKEKRKEEDPKKGKTKLGKSLDKSHDNTRLDLLQTTMDSGRGRESLVLDRGDIKLEEERKKESSRKLSGDGKKDKDPGLFSTFFGGGKKKSDRDSLGKKSSRNLSPDPPHRILKPDIDYNWTRFSILEERAIYRMAHMKLANPRRALYSQVLLSNFMYSYLAKVQQMHPQIQVAQAPAQKQQAPPRQQAPQRRQDQPEEYYQYQRYQDVRQAPTSPALNPKLTHSVTRQQQQQQDQQLHAHQSTPAEANGYVEDSQMYEGDHHNTTAAEFDRPQSRASQYSTADGSGKPSLDGSSGGGGGGRAAVNVNGNGHVASPSGSVGGAQQQQGAYRSSQPPAVAASGKQPYIHQQFHFEESRGQDEDDDEMW